MSPTKKWLLGCGGCLGVLFVVLMALGILLYVVQNQFMASSEQISRSIIGSDVPKGYRALGIGLAGQTMVAVASPKGKVLLLLEQSLHGPQYQKLFSENTSETVAVVNAILGRFTASSSLLKQSSFKYLGATKVATQAATKNDHSLVSISVAFEPQEGTRVPMAAIAVPRMLNRVVLVLSFDFTQDKTAEITADNPAFKDLTQSMLDLIDTTGLKKWETLDATGGITRIDANTLPLEKAVAQ